MSYASETYKKISIHTASKEQILLMLYQSAIKNCKKAIEAIDEKQISQKGEYIGKLQDIVMELNNSLDFSVGGDIAKELSSLYDFIIFSSSKANMEMNKVYLENCLSILNTLYSAWVEAVKSLKESKPQEVK